MAKTIGRTTWLHKLRTYFSNFGRFSREIRISQTFDSRRFGHTVTVTVAAIILVGTGRPPMRSRHPSRSRAMHGSPGPSRCRSLATPGSIVVGHRSEVRQEARGPSGWSSTRSSVGPPRRFRQVGNGVGQMTSRMISPGARLAISSKLF